MALTEREEQFVRDGIIDHTPLRVLNPEHVTTAGRGANESAGNAEKHVDRLIQAKMGPRVDADVNADEEVRKLLKKKSVDLEPGEVYSLGVSRDQIFNLDKKELRALIALKTANAIEEGFAPRPSPAGSKPSLPRRAFDAMKQTWIEVGA